MREAPLDDQAAESFMLRGYERGIVSHRHLPVLIREWREPRHEEFRPRTVWSLFNAFTAVLAGTQRVNPQRFAAVTMRLGELLDGVPAAVIPAEPEFAAAV